MLVPPALLAVENVADFGRSAIWLHPADFGEVDEMTLSLEFGRSLFGILHQGELAGGQAPAHLGKFGPILRVTDNRR